MNERIRELREQAWTLVSNEERDRGELYEVREQWERCDQKFAELIVKECALTAGLMEQQGRKNIGAQLLDNFGVKE